jgi:nucleoside-diphosphate-sugar epimerase
MREHITLVEADLSDATAIDRVVTEVHPAAIVHLAWYTEPSRYRDDVGQNLASVVNSIRVLDASLRGDCPRVVLAGTCLEQARLAAPSIYEASKRAVHALSMGLDPAALSVVCAHVYYLFGPGEDARRVVPSVIHSLLRSEPIATTDGLQRRDYLHVADVASAFCTLAETASPGGVDICSGTAIRLRDLLSLIGDEMGKVELIRFGSLPSGVNDDLPATGDPARLWGLGWKPRYDLRKAVIDTISWWSNEGGRS